jgi:peptidoglycan-associated lipoprotein
MIRRTLKASRAASIVAMLGFAALAAGCANPQQGAGASGGIDSGNLTPGSAQDFVVNAGDRVFFESDSSELDGRATGTLDRQADWLKRYPRARIVIEGHADERGTREYNFALGARRASVVKEYLAAKGVTGGRIDTASFGKERPVAVCNDLSCWSQNRRAQTVLR